jgi:hypothetical protein
MLAWIVTSSYLISAEIGRQRRNAKRFANALPAILCSSAHNLADFTIPILVACHGIGKRRGAAVTDQVVVEEWQPFFIALAGASAALAGLVFVAMSLHPQPILVNRLTRSRAYIAAFGYLIGVALALIMLLPARTAPVGSFLLIGLGLGGGVLVIYREFRLRHAGLSVFRVVFGDILLLTPIAAGSVGLLEPHSEVPFLVVAVTVGAGLFVLFSQSWALVLHGVIDRAYGQHLASAGSNKSPPANEHDDKAITEAAPA